MTDYAIRRLLIPVVGEPKPAGSKRAFQHNRTGRIVVVDSSGQQGKTWRSTVQDSALDAKARTGQRGLLEGPLTLDVTFYVHRPKGHYGTGRNAATIKESSPTYPAVKPDVTKLLRAVEDALTSVVWRDDAQIVQQFARKLYGEPDGALIVITQCIQLPPHVNTGWLHPHTDSEQMEAA